MTDITKCTGNNCFVRDKCYRYTSPPNDINQSWFQFVPAAILKCDYFIDNRQSAAPNDSDSTQ